MLQSNPMAAPRAGQPSPKPSGIAQLARAANFGFAALLALCLVLQIFFAGLGALVSSSYWPVHRAFGYSLQWFALAMPLVGIFARLSWRGHLLNVAALVLFAAQYALIWLPGRNGLPAELRALHAVNALVLFMVASTAAATLWRRLRSNERARVGTMLMSTPTAQPITTTQADAQMANVPANRTTPQLILLFGCAFALVVGIILCAGLAFLSWGALAGGVEFGGQPSNRSQPTGPVNTLAGGQRTFERQCSMCHSTGTDRKVGPGLAGMFDEGGPTLPNGVDYGGKLPNGNDINDANVAAWIRSGGNGQIGQMPPRNLNDEELAGVIAYLKTLHK